MKPNNKNLELMSDGQGKRIDKEDGDIQGNKIKLSDREWEDLVEKLIDRYYGRLFAKDLQKQESYPLPEGIRKNKPSGMELWADIWDVIDDYNRTVADTKKKLTIIESDRTIRRIMNEPNHVLRKSVYKTLKFYINPTPDPFKLNLPYILIDRNLELEEIAKLLSNHNIGIISGLAGTGKTTLAMMYYNRETSRYDQRYFVEVKGDIKNSILETPQIEHAIKRAFLLDSEEIEIKDPVQRLYLTFKKSRSVLLILDNADDHDMLMKSKSFLEKIPATILITSRASPKFYNTMNINNLSPNDALNLFLYHCAHPYKRIISEEGRDYVKEIVLNVEYNVQIIIFLACFYLDNFGIISLKDILAIIKANKNEHVASHTNKLDESELVNLLVPFFRINKLDQQQLSLLTEIALLPPRKIPAIELFELLNRGLEINKVLRRLSLTGWIKVEGNEVFSMHNMLQWTIEKCIPPTILSFRNIIKNLTGLLGYESKVDWTTKQKYLIYFQHIMDKLKPFLLEASPEDKAAIAVMKLNTAGIYFHRGHVKKAYGIAKDVYREWNYLPPDSFEHKRIKGKLLDTLAACEFQLDQHKKSLKRTIREVYPIWREIYPDERYQGDRITAILHISLCCLHLWKNNKKAGLKYRNQAYKCARRVIYYISKAPEIDYMALASAYESLANLYIEDENYKDAERILLKTLKLRKTQLGDEPHGSITYNNYGLAHLYEKIAKCNPAESQLYYQKTIDSYKAGLEMMSRLVADTTSYAKMLFDVALECHKMGDTASAIELLEKSHNTVLTKDFEEPGFRLKEINLKLKEFREYQQRK